MKMARDVREQLMGLLERVEIEPSSSSSDLDAIKKSITAGKAIDGKAIGHVVWC